MTTEIVPVPNTIGELVEILSKYPKETKLNVFTIQDYEGHPDAVQSFKIAIEKYDGATDLAFDAIDLTFADGYTLV